MLGHCSRHAATSCQPGKQDLTLDANETSIGLSPNSFNKGIQSGTSVPKTKMNLFHLLVQKTEVSSFWTVDPVVPVVDPLATESTTESTPLDLQMSQST